MDADLVRRLARGDRTAFDEFYARVSGPVYQIALAIVGDAADAEDVAQEALLQLWREADRYDPARGTLVGWAVAVARSRALDRARASGARKRLVERASQFVRPAAPEDRMDDGPGPGRIRRALAALPPEQRQVVELAYFAGLSQTEIAAELGIPLGTVKTRVKLGMEKLRAALPHE
jgi:RNA polymerase sigma-70 factor (ECF subfamily)